eukprot:1161468-Pelagomonas_calceolata.AAC.5
MTRSCKTNLLLCASAGGRDVDVLSEAAGKGRGLSFLLQRLKEAGFEPSNVQACLDFGRVVWLSTSCYPHKARLFTLQVSAIVDKLLLRNDKTYLLLRSAVGLDAPCGIFFVILCDVVPQQGSRINVPGVKGCVVSNAHPELRAFAEAQVAKGDAAHICQATEPCAGGILQAMRHFGLLHVPEPTSSPAGASQAAGALDTLSEDMYGGWA